MKLAEKARASENLHGLTSQPHLTRLPRSFKKTQTALRKYVFLLTEAAFTFTFFYFSFFFF